MIDFRYPRPQVDFNQPEYVGNDVQVYVTKKIRYPLGVELIKFDFFLIFRSKYVVYKNTLCGQKLIKKIKNTLNLIKLFKQLKNILKNT